MGFVSLGLVGGDGEGEILLYEVPLEVVLPVAECRPSCVRSRHEIAMFRGDSLNQPVQILRDGAPFNLIGATLAFTVRRTDRSEVLIENEPVITNASEGRFTIALNPSDTEDLEGNVKYLYDVEYRVGGSVRTLVKDRLFLKHDITY